MQNHSDKSTTAFLYVLMFLYSIFTTMAGVQMADLTSEFNMKLSAGGIFTTVINVGCMAGIILSGMCLDRFSKKRLVIISYMIFCAGLSIASVSESYVLFMVVLVWCGVSAKFVDASINAAISEIYNDKKGFYLNLLHCSFGIGSFSGPIIIGVLLSKGCSWRNTYLILSICCFAAVIFFGVNQKKEKREKVVITHVEEIGLKTLIAPKVLLMMLILAFYCGHQMGINCWFPSYLRTVLGTDAITANLGVSVYWAGLIVSRLVCAFLTRFIKSTTILKWGLFIGMIAIWAGVLSKNVLLTFIGVGCSGLFAGAAIPLVLTVGYSWFPKAQGKISMLLFLCIAGGAALFPWVMGVASIKDGLYTGMWIDSICLMAAVVAAFWLARSEEKA